jgi:hypothetical protein
MTSQSENESDLDTNGGGSGFEHQEFSNELFVNSEGDGNDERNISTVNDLNDEQGKSNLYNEF